MLLQLGLKKSCPLLLLLLSISVTLQAQLPAPLPPAEWVVRLESGQSIEAVATSLHAEVIGPVGALKDYYLLSFSNAQTNVAFMLQNDDRIRWRQQQFPHRLYPRNLDDPRLTDQWHLNNTGQGGGTAGVDANVFPAWNQGVNGSNVQICIVDDGLEKDHPDLSPNFILADSWDFNTGNGNDPSPVTGFDTHGTPCAGVAGAKGNNGIGVSGVAYDANLSGIRLIAGPVTSATEAMALTFHLQNNHIYSNSWGPYDNGTYDAAGTLVHEALREGAFSGRNGLGNIYVWAAGNGRRNEDNTNYDGYVNSIYTIGVGAFADDGIYSYYSEPGASMLLSAPSSGGNSSITTTYIFNGYTNGFGGTSSATPLVAGVVALMLDANPTLGWRDVQHILVESAAVIDSTDTDWMVNAAGHEINHNYGFGAVDAAAAVSLANAWENVLPASSDTLPLLTVNDSIPDGTGTTVIAYGDSIHHTISVDRDLTLEHVELKVNFSHSEIGHLRVRLISPSGTESMLSHARFVSTPGLTGWTYMTVRNWGESSAGEWTVLVDDGLSGEQGDLEDIQLILHGTDESCTASDLTIDEAAILAGTYRTGGEIQSAGTIQAGSEVAYQAGTRVRLNTGFHAAAGSKFTAVIESCTPPEVRRENLRDVVEQSENDLIPGKEPALKVYPNPMESVATIQYQLHTGSEVILELLDMNGRLMRLLQPRSRQAAGGYQLTLEVGNMPAGVYILRLRSDHGRQVERIVVR